MLRSCITKKYYHPVFFHKKYLASAILLAVNTAYAADNCDLQGPQAGVSCVQNGNQLDITIYSDIDNQTSSPAYLYGEPVYLDPSIARSDKVNISLEAGKTITSDAMGIEARGTSSTLEVDVSTSGNIYTGKLTDSDAADPQAPITGPSGGMIYDETNIRETQHAGVYLTGSSGGLLAVGSLLQQSGSQIVNNSASKDTAAVYSQALESRITSSGVIRSQVGDAIRLEDTRPEYTYSSGGYIIIDPQGTFDVHLNASSVVEGGSEGAGIKTTGGTISTIQIDQGATLGALSDVAINAAGYDAYYPHSNLPTVNMTHYSGAKTSILNAGTITGVVQLSSGEDTIINDTTGVWNVRQWSDSDRDGIRDTVAPVAISDFGGGTTELINRGVISLTENPDGTTNNALFDNLKTFQNQGSLKLTNNVAGDQFTLNGDYAGNGGVIELDTVLGDDNALTDKIIINGSTSGQSYVSINNLGGTGAQTREGIKVIEVNGDSSGEFTQKGRIVGGAYDYYLHKNSVSTQDGNWYLRSSLPSEGSAPTKPEPGLVNRPEPGSYMFNHMAANTLFQTRLHDRLGEAQYTDVLSGEKQVTSLWLRQVGGHNRAHDSSDQLKTQGNRYVVQIGGDLTQWSTDELDRWHLGAMAGYARYNGNTESKYSKYKSRGSVEGYSVGLYGTWYANDKEKTGSYVDSWVLYNWFDNEVKGDQLNAEKYKSRGITTSLETGYTFKLNTRESDAVGYYIQPKAQLIWMGVRSSDHTEHASSGSSRVKFSGDGNIQSRLGIRAYMNGKSHTDKDKQHYFQPFIETNWIHNGHDFGASINDQGNEITGTRNIGEVKLGVEGQLSPRLDMWGNVTQQLGSSGYSDTQAIVGIKYRF